jgi:hypothetical protein
VQTKLILSVPGVVKQGMGLRWANDLLLDAMGCTNYNLVKALFINMLILHIKKIWL